MPVDLTQRLTDIETRELGRFLEEAACPMSLPKAQGFLTGIGSAPTLIMPSEWQAAILGDPGFESLEEAQHILSALARLYNGLLADLDEGRPSLPEDEALPSWCDGYLEAVRMDKCWQSGEETPNQLFPIVALSTVIKLERDQDEERELRLEARAELPSAVCEIHRHWKQWRQEGSAELAATPFKVGRNDPCPCGSGLKYKKCCLHRADRPATDDLGFLGFAYDADVAPDPELWLALDEGEQLAAITAFHRAVDPLPDYQSESLHAGVHSAVETQIALNEPPATGETLERLMRDGLSRHDAIHAIAAVIIETLVDAGSSFDSTAFVRGLHEMTAEKWLQMEDE